MRPTSELDRMTDYLDKKKTIEVCNEMLEFLKHDDVVYSIRETGTGMNIHVELDHSTGEYPTFTIFKARPTKKISGNNFLKPPECPEVKKISLLKSMSNNGKIVKACSAETLENQKRQVSSMSSSLKKKSASMYNMNHSFRKQALKKTSSNETIDCGDLGRINKNETTTDNKSFLLSPFVQRKKVVKRNSFTLGSRESVVSLDSIGEIEESEIETTPVEKEDISRWYAQYPYYRVFNGSFHANTG